MHLLAKCYYGMLARTRPWLLAGLRKGKVTEHCRVVFEQDVINQSLAALLELSKLLGPKKAVAFDLLRAAKVERWLNGNG